MESNHKRTGSHEKTRLSTPPIDVGRAPVMLAQLSKEVMWPAVAYRGWEEFEFWERREAMKWEQQQKATTVVSSGQTTPDPKRPSEGEILVSFVKLPGPTSNCAWIPKSKFYSYSSITKRIPLGSDGMDFVQKQQLMEAMMCSEEEYERLDLYLEEWRRHVRDFKKIEALSAQALRQKDTPLVDSSLLDGLQLTQTEEAEDEEHSAVGINIGSRDSSPASSVDGLEARLNLDAHRRNSEKLREWADVSNTVHSDSDRDSINLSQSPPTQIGKIRKSLHGCFSSEKTSRQSESPSEPSERGSKEKRKRASSLTEDGKGDGRIITTQLLTQTSDNEEVEETDQSAVDRPGRKTKKKRKDEKKIQPPNQAPGKIDLNLPWGEFFGILKAHGWVYEYGSGLISSLYLRPGVTKADVPRCASGVHYFTSEDEVRRFVRRALKAKSSAWKEPCSVDDGNDDEPFLLTQMEDCGCPVDPNMRWGKLFGELEKQGWSKHAHEQACLYLRPGGKVKNIEKYKEKTDFFTSEEQVREFLRRNPSLWASPVKLAQPKRINEKRSFDDATKTAEHDGDLVISDEEGAGNKHMSEFLMGDRELLEHLKTFGWTWKYGKKGGLDCQVLLRPGASDKAPFVDGRHFFTSMKTVRAFLRMTSKNGGKEWMEPVKEDPSTEDDSDDIGKFLSQDDFTDAEIDPTGRWSNCWDKLSSFGWKKETPVSGSEIYLRPGIELTDLECPGQHCQGDHRHFHSIEKIRRFLCVEIEAKSDDWKKAFKETEERRKQGRSSRPQKMSTLSSVPEDESVSMSEEEMHSVIDLSSPAPTVDDSPLSRFSHLSQESLLCTDEIDPTAPFAELWQALRKLGWHWNYQAYRGCERVVYIRPGADFKDPRYIENQHYFGDMKHVRGFITAHLKDGLWKQVASLEEKIFEEESIESTQTYDEAPEINPDSRWGEVWRKLKEAGWTSSVFKLKEVYIRPGAAATEEYLENKHYFCSKEKVKDYVRRHLHDEKWKAPITNNIRRTRNNESKGFATAESDKEPPTNKRDWLKLWALLSKHGWKQVSCDNPTYSKDFLYLRPGVEPNDPYVMHKDYFCSQSQVRGFVIQHWKDKLWNKKVKPITGPTLDLNSPWESIWKVLRHYKWSKRKSCVERGKDVYLRPNADENAEHLAENVDFFYSQEAVKKFLKKHTITGLWRVPVEEELVLSWDFKDIWHTLKNFGWTSKYQKGGHTDYVYIRPEADDCDPNHEEGDAFFNGKDSLMDFLKDTIISGEWKEPFFIGALQKEDSQQTAKHNKRGGKHSLKQITPPNRKENKLGDSLLRLASPDRKKMERDSIEKKSAHKATPKLDFDNLKWAELYSELAEYGWHWDWLKKAGLDIKVYMREGVTLQMCRNGRAKKGIHFFESEDDVFNFVRRHMHDVIWKKPVDLSGEDAEAGKKLPSKPPNLNADSSSQSLDDEDEFFIPATPEGADETAAMVYKLKQMNINPADNAPGSWMRLWEKLECLGWSWDYVSFKGGLEAQCYLNVGRKKTVGKDSTAQEGIDYFRTEEDVRRYIHTLISPRKEKQDISHSISYSLKLEEADGCITDEDEESDEEDASFPSIHNNPGYYQAVAAILKRRRLDATAFEPSGWKILWLELEKLGWEWDYGSGLSPDLYFPSGRNKAFMRENSTVVNWDYFNSKEELQTFLRRLVLDTSAKLTRRNSLEPETDQLGYSKKNDFNDLIWSELWKKLRKVGWTWTYSKAAGTGLQVHWYFRPGAKSLGDTKTLERGTHYFVEEDEVREFLKEHPTQWKKVFKGSCTLPLKKREVGRSQSYGDIADTKKSTINKSKADGSSESASARKKRRRRKTDPTGDKQWAQLWNKLSQLGWSWNYHTCPKTRISSNHYFAPGVTKEDAEKQEGKDFFTTQEALIEFCEKNPDVLDIPSDTSDSESEDEEGETIQSKAEHNSPATSPKRDEPEDIDLCAEFNVTWKILRDKFNWTWKYGTGCNSTTYLRPGAETMKDKIEGADYFTKEQDLTKFLEAHIDDGQYKFNINEICPNWEWNKLWSFLTTYGWTETTLHGKTVYKRRGAQLNEMEEFAFFQSEAEVREYLKGPGQNGAWRLPFSDSCASPLAPQGTDTPPTEPMAKRFQQSLISNDRQRGLLSSLEEKNPEKWMQKYGVDPSNSWNQTWKLLKFHNWHHAKKRNIGDVYCRPGAQATTQYIEGKHYFTSQDQLLQWMVENMQTEKWKFKVTLEEVFEEQRNLEKLRNTEKLRKQLNSQQSIKSLQKTLKRSHSLKKKALDNNLKILQSTPQGPKKAKLLSEDKENKQPKTSDQTNRQMKGMKRSRQASNIGDISPNDWRMKLISHGWIIRCKIDQQIYIRTECNEKGKKDWDVFESLDAVQLFLKDHEMLIGEWKDVWPKLKEYGWYEVDQGFAPQVKGNQLIPSLASPDAVMRYLNKHPYIVESWDLLWKRLQSVGWGKDADFWGGLLFYTPDSVEEDVPGGLASEKEVRAFVAGNPNAMADCSQSIRELNALQILIRHDDSVIENFQHPQNTQTESAPMEMSPLLCTQDLKEGSETEELFSPESLASPEGSSALWSKLESRGWRKKKSYSDFFEYYYIRPGRTEHGEEGEDYFTSLEDVKICFLDKEEESTPKKRLAFGGSSKKEEALQRLKNAHENLQMDAPLEFPERRRPQLNVILEFCKTKFEEESGGSIYICGSPGVGKTMTIHQALRVLREELSKDGWSDYVEPKSCEVNGSHFLEANSFFQDIYLRLIDSQSDIASSECFRELCLKFNPKSRRKNMKTYILVVDEIDQLLTGSSQVVQQLFSWAHAPSSTLILIGIANSINFPGKILAGLPSAVDYNPTTVVFQTYSSSDMEAIISQRLGNLIDKRAAKICAMRTANKSGDARMALSLCKKAVEKAINDIESKPEEECGLLDNKPLITLSDMAQISTQKDDKIVSRIQCCTTGAQVVLAAALSSLIPKNEPLTKASLYGVYRKAGVMTNNFSEEEFNDSFEQLVESGIISSKTNTAKGDSRPLVIHATRDDVQAALPDQSFYKSIWNKMVI